METSAKVQFSFRKAAMALSSSVRQSKLQLLKAELVVAGTAKCPPPAFLGLASSCQAAGKELGICGETRLHAAHLLTAAGL